jgi:hypothetical protein
MKDSSEYVSAKSHSVANNKAPKGDEGDTDEHGTMPSPWRRNKGEIGGADA